MHIASTILKPVPATDVEPASSASPAAAAVVQEVGIIGLGLLGGALSCRLLANGMAVAGYDPDHSRRDFFQAHGGVGLETAAEVARRCRRILLVLPDDEITQKVVAEILPFLRSGSILLNATTGAPAEAAAFAAAMSAQGIHCLDATVSGSSEQAGRGGGVYFVGGDAAALADCADIFQALGGRLIATGPAGSGAKMKLITNLVLGLNRAALAEGLAFAGALGVAPEVALSGLQASAGYSRIMDSKGAKMLSGDFTPVARLSQHLKDVRLMLAATPLPLPMTQTHCRLLEKAVDMGYGGLDNSAIIRIIQEGSPG